MERESSFKNYIIALIDILIVSIAFMLIIFISNPSNEFIYRILNIRKIIYAPIITIVIVFSFLDMYKDTHKRYTEIVFSSIFACILGFLSFFIFINLRNWHLSHISISFYMIFLILLCFVILERLLIEYIVRKISIKGKLLIVGREKDIYKISYDLISNKLSNYSVEGLFIIDKGINQIEKHIKNADKIVLLANLTQHDRSIIMSLCQKNIKEVFLIPELYDISIMKPRLTQIDNTPYLYLGNIGLLKFERDIKRIMDICISVIGIILFTPLMLACALLIKCTSKGKVFFRQERITINSKVFNIIKFRTMIENAEKNTGAVLTKANDSRVTKIGSFMRKTRLDEIPQFFNVLIGDMSIIGPRPERPIFVNQFKNEIPLYSKRHTVKAGISGLAQIMGKYSTTARDKLRYDLIYIRSYSIILDIKILFLTVKTALLDLGSIKEENNIDYTKNIEKKKITVIRG